MSLQIASLREEHLEDAAALVSVRYKALREHVPLLPSRYEDIDTTLHMLRDLTEAPGVVAIRGSRLIGFLLGFVIPMFLGKRSVYSPEWANGVELGESRRVYEEMYGHLSAQALWFPCPGRTLGNTLSDPQSASRHRRQLTLG